MKKIILFDLDHTLLSVDSDYEWGVFTTRIGWTDPAYFAAQNDRFFADYKRGALDIAQYVRFATEAIRAKGALASAKAHQQYMQEVILPAIGPAARELVAQHRAAGDPLVIVTATNEFVTRPIASAFGIEELIAVRLVDYDASAPAAQSGAWITGEIEGVPSAREGKVHRVEAWLAAKGLARADVDLTFYSDSINDLPLLDYVDHPVATNPDDKLRAVALARQWRILELFEKR